MARVDAQMMDPRGNGVRLEWCAEPDHWVEWNDGTFAAVAHGDIAAERSRQIKWSIRPLTGRLFEIA